MSDRRLLENSDVRVTETGPDTRILEASASASATIGGVVGAASGSAYDPAGSPTFIFQRTATVNAALVSGSHTDFTAAFTFDDPDFRTFANGGGIYNNLPGGVPADFAIFSDEALTTALAFKVTSYNAATGTITGWVKIPSLTTSTVIYIGYGDPTCFTYQGDDENIYDANVYAHYEFGDGTTLSVLDSTSNNNDGTSVNSPTAATGKVRGGINFASASTQSVTLPQGFADSNNFTWSAWLKGTTFPNAYNSVIVRAASGRSTHIQVKSNGKLNIGNEPAIGSVAGYDGTGVHTLSTGTWYRVTITGDDGVAPTLVSGYVSGVFDGSGTDIFDFDGDSTPTSLGINPLTSGQEFNGVIDEVMIARTLRSVNWILTEYNNQNDPEVFWSLGLPEGSSVANVTEEGELLDEAFGEFVDALLFSPIETGEVSDLALLELVETISVSPIEYGEVSDSAEIDIVESLFVDVSESIEADDTTGLFAGAASPIAPGILVLTHIYFDEGREGFAAVQVDAPSHSHEPRVLSFGRAEREIPVPVGPPRIGNIHLIFADTDQYFRKKFGAKTPRMRKIDLLIGPQGGSEAMFQKPASAVIDSVTFPPGAMEIEAYDARFNWLRNPINGLITEEHFPNLPQASRGTFFPMIFGIVTSEGRGDQGAINCIHVDTVNHLYAINRSTIEGATIYVKEPDETVFTVRTSGVSIVEQAFVIDGVSYATMTFAQFSSALPEGSEVRADVRGINYRGAWGYLGEDPGPDALENPVDALINFLFTIEQHEHASVNYDFQSFLDVYDACNELDYRIAWAITESITPEAALTQILGSFQIDMFPSQQDKIKIVLSAIVPDDRDTFTDTLHLERESEVIFLASPTKNRFRYKFALLPAEGRYALEDVYNNTSDQETLANENHDGIELEDVELAAIADPDVALAVIADRSSWCDQSSHRMRVRIGAPPNLSKIDLARIIGITHYGGLEDGGWVNEPFKIIRVALDFTNLEYELDLIKRVAPPRPPTPQPLEVGTWKLNSRVGPWYVESNRRLFLVMCDTRATENKLVFLGTPTSGTAVVVVDDNVFPALANTIGSFDCKRWENKVYCITQEVNTGRVAFHIADLATATWELTNEQILASNSNGDCGVTIAVRDDGQAVVVFYGDRDTAGPATYGSIEIAPLGAYRRAYIAHREAVGDWSTAQKLGEPDTIMSVFPIAGIDYNGAVHINVGRVEAYPTSGRVRHVYNVNEPADVANTADFYTQIYLGDNTLTSAHEFRTTMSLSYSTTFLCGDSTAFTYEGSEYTAFPIGKEAIPFLAIWNDSDIAANPTHEITLTNYQIHTDSFGAQMPDINVRWLNEKLHIIMGVYNAGNEWGVYKTIDPPFTTVAPSASGFPMDYQIGPVWNGGLARCGSEVYVVGGVEYVFKITSGTVGIPGFDYYSILESYATDDLPTASDYTLADFIADYS